MLRLENVNKYFNKNRKNEIHVINETSLEMGSTGLVALLGPSGCGKTTLLNVIGGLDKVNGGFCVFLMITSTAIRITSPAGSEIHALLVNPAMIYVTNEIAATVIA